MSEGFVRVESPVVRDMTSRDLRHTNDNPSPHEAVKVADRLEDLDRHEFAKELRMLMAHGGRDETTANEVFLTVVAIEHLVGHWLLSLNVVDSLEAGAKLPEEIS